MNLPPPVPKRSGSKLVLWIVLAGGLFILLSFVTWRISISWQVRSKLAALRQAGYPTTPQELEQNYYAPVAPASNAATYFTAAFAKLRLPEYSSDSFLNRFTSAPTNLTAPLSEAETINIERLLEDNREALVMLHKTPTATVCRHPLDFTMGFALHLPHLSKIRDSMELLSMETAWEASQGKTGEAIECLDSALRVADSLKDEPLDISQLVRMSGNLRTAWSLERMLNRQAPTESQLAHLANKFRGEENPSAMEHALAGELCIGILTFQSQVYQLNALAVLSNSADGSSTSGQAISRAGWEFLKLSGFTARDFNFYLKTMSEYLAATRVPFPQRLDAAQRAEDEFLKSCPGHFYIFSGLLVPSLAKSNGKDASAIANLHNAQAALAIERFRLAHQNQLPDKLSDLVPALLPAVPTDPFNGEPLHFKKLATGYEVYSVGPNRKDDGGVKSSKYNGPDDITFTVER